MIIETKGGTLRNISPDDIWRNPENPRLYFRTEEEGALLASISRYGIQVPLTVYKDGEHFVLIDGERRWRCATKLNLKTVPALINSQPTRLQNLLLMFNIHALREQWDYVTIAAKLPDVISLFKSENDREPNEPELSELTGLTRGQIRRCRLLLNLPSPYMALLLKELELPKMQQRLSEDFFIEMERALRAVGNRFPEEVPDIDGVRNVLITKFRDKVIKNATDLRKLSKIATAVAGLGVPERTARTAIRKIVAENNVSINDVYSVDFEAKVDERRLVLQIHSVMDYISHIEAAEDSQEISSQMTKELVALRDAINHLMDYIR